MFEPGSWQQLYDLWTLRPDPPAVDALGRGLPQWIADHRFDNRHRTEPWWTLWLLDAEDRPLVQLEHGPAQGDAPLPPWEEDFDPEVLRILDEARSHFLVSIRDDTEGRAHAVQAALSVAWSVLGQRQGLVHDLSAMRLLTEDDLRQILSRNAFAIEDHVSLHLVTDESTQQGWLHSHGMSKFGCSDLETFDLDTSLGRDAGKLVNQLLLSAALGTRSLLETPLRVPGGTLRIHPSSALRPGVTSVPPEEFLGHDGPYLCLVDGDTFGSVSALVEGYLHRTLSGVENREEEQEVTRHLLPLVRRHFTLNGPSEDFEYFARIPLRVQRGESTTRESVWVRITRWRDSSVRGTLASDSMLDSHLQVGVEVEFEPDDIEAILLSVYGEPVAGKHLEKLLRS